MNVRYIIYSICVCTYYSMRMNVFIEICRLHHYCNYFHFIFLYPTQTILTLYVFIDGSMFLNLLFTCCRFQINFDYRILKRVCAHSVSVFMSIHPRARDTSCILITLYNIHVRVLNILSFLFCKSRIFVFFISVGIAKKSVQGICFRKHFYVIIGINM